MALFGTQLIITMISACVLQKLGPFYSFARWLLCSTGLRRCCVPSDEVLRDAVGLLKNNKKKSKRRDTDADADDFLIPKNCIAELEDRPVLEHEIETFSFYAEYRWLMDFCACSLLVYIVTEIYYSLFTVKSDVNLSLLWCLMVVGFAVKVLCSMTAAFFRASSRCGEMEVCVVAGLAYFVVSMAVLVTDDQMLELNLQPAYASFNDSATRFLLTHSAHHSGGVASVLVFRLLLCLWSGVMGGVLVFPGLRYTRMHYDCLSVSGPLMRVACHVSFSCPLLCVIMWLRPLARHYLTEVPIGSHHTSTIMSGGVFESVRVCTVCVCVAVRVLLCPALMQAYLTLARSRTAEMKHQAGRVRNTQLHRMVNSVYQYVCAAALQLLAPLALTLFLTLMYKTLGEYSWTGSDAAEMSPDASRRPSVDVRQSAGVVSPQSGEWTYNDDEDMASMSRRVTITLTALKQVFTRDLYRGVFGYAVWWNCFVMFTSSVLGTTMLKYT